MEDYITVFEGIGGKRREEWKRLAQETSAKYTEDLVIFISVSTVMNWEFVGVLEFILLT